MKINTTIDPNITILQQDIVRRYGLTTAAVLARIQMYCQMEDGVCKASMETIGDELGIDRATANRHAQRLCEEGYLEDLTPDLRNHPHTYRDTGKANVSISISGNCGVAENTTSVANCTTKKNGKNSGVANYNTDQNCGDSKCNTNSSGDSKYNTKSAGVAKNHMNMVVVVNPSLTIEMTQQQHETFEELLRAKVSRRKAATLATTLPPERITFAIDVYRHMRDLGKVRGQGYLVDFLEEGWDAPEEYIPVSERCEECHRAKIDHAEGCSQAWNKYTAGGFLCPHCMTSPCTCGEVEADSLEYRVGEEG